MDSRLLNAFHDDPFDGNYKYDSDAQFWSNDSGTLGLQLAETLHGILPIAPSEVISNSLLNNAILKEGDYSLESKNTKMFENYEDVSPMKLLNKTQFSYQDTIENVSSQTNSTYDSDFLQSVDYNGDVVEIGNDDKTLGTVDFDELRSCSRSTFRSRTDSSSIGDYESHSSDYDNDDDDYEEDEDGVVFQNDLTELTSNLNTKQNLDCTFNSDDNDLKKSLDEVDPFTMQLDVSTFDLATFITQDDQILYNQSSTLAANNASHISLQESVEFTIPSDSDSDSDVIVDVETVETEEKDIISWSKEKANIINNVKETKPIETKFPEKSTVAPKKCSNVFVKRKFGIGQGKNLNMHRNSLQATPKSEETNKQKQNNTNTNIRKTNLVEKKKPSSNVQTKIITPQENKTEQIMKKQESKPADVSVRKTSHIDLVDHKQTTVNKVCTNLDKNKLTRKKEDSIGDKANSLKEEMDVVSQTHEKLPKKRKLNLEEYKKRRENPSMHFSSVQSPVPVVTKPLTKSQINKPQPTEAVASIVNSLKENQSSKPFVDPITEAKNKVLRLQELKKAQQIKIIESTVSSKVARVTKLLPLKDIVKGSSYKNCDGDSYSNNKSEYEEIIIVSAGCNTDITIPPNGYSIVPQNPESNLSRSLLKSNVLLANISNSFEKVRSNENIKISNNSLIVSIQDTVVKQSSPLVIVPTQEKTSSTTAEHGEDKIIMHLRKDRIRKRTFCQSIQTEILPEFPPLTLRLQTSRRHSNSSSTRRKKEHRKYRARQSSYSSDDETYNYKSHNNSSSKKLKSKRSRRHRSSISSSYSDSEDNSKRHHRDSDSSSQSRGCSISSNEHRSRSFDRIYNRNSRSRSKSIRSGSKRDDGSSYIEKNVSAPAVEERRIVYVGRIEHETTKEMLRKKFIGYGPIKQITIHYKDTGMKYGFITYDKSEDAFRVIDCGQKDDTINMYDISFGGRRAFCRQSYADLDNAGMNSYQSYAVPHQKAPPKEEESFEALLLKVKAKLNATKSSGSNLKT